MFQKIADAATYSKGASKDIGHALTRVCLRHKAVETRLKNLTTALMDSMIMPLQDKIEDWKKQVLNLDKDRTKEFKKCRAELKKRSQGTLKLQKKAKRAAGENMQSLVESSMMNVNQQKSELDDMERTYLRAAMVEDRTRYSFFVNALRPVVKEEYEMMYEIGHLQEAMQTVDNAAKDPSNLPQSSEELILDLKPSLNFFSDSPTHSTSQLALDSIGSRKNSVCSISSITSNSSYQDNDSISLSFQKVKISTLTNNSSGISSVVSPPQAIAVEPVVVPNPVSQPPKPVPARQKPAIPERPHTISAVYEKGHQRLSLSQQTFVSPPAVKKLEATSSSQVQSSSPKKPPVPVVS